MRKLDNKVAIVTGAARGLGAAAAQALAAEGATVVLADVLDEVGEQQAAQMRAAGQQAHYAHLDVRDEAAWQALVADTVARHGGLDCLVNNAGITFPVTIEEVSADELRRIMDINFIGPAMGMKHAIQAMKARGAGTIINIASNSTRKVVPVTTAYSPSKAALANLSRVAALHCAPHHIRVNSIHPGPMQTDMLLGGEVTADHPQVRALIEAIPMKRMGKPSELGGMVVFLASEDSSYVTGAEFFVDGGASAV